MDSQTLGRILIVAGLAAAAVGAYLALGGRLPLFRLPGDLVVQRGATTIYIPITTMILLSLMGTLVLQIVAAWGRR